MGCNRVYEKKCSAHLLYSALKRRDIAAIVTGQYYRDVFIANTIAMHTPCHGEVSFLWQYPCMYMPLYMTLWFCSPLESCLIRQLKHVPISSDPLPT